ncbi:MAG: N-acetyltransferase [Burkholderiales bacterium]|jgi:RimJ/RimL family protein N-acetyltransferase|nr:N-acetyltransferase [Burkholderiales bacterium]
MSWKKPVTLNGKYIALVPLSMEHCTDLIAATKDGELWKLWYATVPSPEGMMAEIQHRLDSQDKGTLLPWTVIDNRTNLAIGMTTYLKVSEADRRLDIGWTWYRRSAQMTSVNTECKLLLLKHAFETLKCVAVGFGANFFNNNSRRAIERLGAKFDGIIRNKRIMPNGAVCDFCLYSIIDSEWKTVKLNLESKLLKPMT